MTPQSKIATMKKAIAQAIKVMGDRFGSTDQDVARAIQELKTSMVDTSESRLSRKPRRGQAAGQRVTGKPVWRRTGVCSWKEHEP